MSEEREGGCQCGRVRYRARLEQPSGYLCHCRMCRRATGGASAAFINVRKDGLIWLGNEPAYYRSSPIAQRGFCPACGTPISFDYPDGDTIDLTLGSLDDPGSIAPLHHYAIDAALPMWLDTHALPAYRLEENPNTVDRWIKACGKLPD